MRDLPYSYDILVENIADPAHVSVERLQGADSVCICKCVHMVIMRAELCMLRAITPCFILAAVSMIPHVDVRYLRCHCEHLLADVCA